MLQPHVAAWHLWHLRTLPNCSTKIFRHEKQFTTNPNTKINFNCVMIDNRLVKLLLVFFCSKFYFVFCPKGSQGILKLQFVCNPTIKANCEARLTRGHHVIDNPGFGAARTELLDFFFENQLIHFFSLKTHTNDGFKKYNVYSQMPNLHMKPIANANKQSSRICVFWFIASKTTQK